MPLLMLAIHLSQFPLSVALDNEQQYQPPLKLTFDNPNCLSLLKLLYLISRYDNVVRIVLEDNAETFHLVIGNNMYTH